MAGLEGISFVAQEIKRTLRQVNTQMKNLADFMTLTSQVICLKKTYYDPSDIIYRYLWFAFVLIIQRAYERFMNAK